jgi:hypothetical protein
MASILPMKKFQTAGAPNVDRTAHVWYKPKHMRGWWKCVLCGGLSRQPSDDAEPQRVEKLTEHERGLCPLVLVPTERADDAPH